MACENSLKARKRKPLRLHAFVTNDCPSLFDGFIRRGNGGHCHGEVLVSENESNNASRHRHNQANGLVLAP